MNIFLYLLLFEGMVLDWGTMCNNIVDSDNPQKLDIYIAIGFLLLLTKLRWPALNINLCMFYCFLRRLTSRISGLKSKDIFKDAATYSGLQMFNPVRK